MFANQEIAKQSPKSHAAVDSARDAAVQLSSAIQFKDDGCRLVTKDKGYDCATVCAGNGYDGPSSQRGNDKCKCCP